MKKSNRWIEALDRVVQAKYSVPAWLWVCVSFVVGLLVLGVALFDPGMAVAFLAALPLGGLVFGPALMLFAAMVMYGMATDTPKWVRVGSFASFCLWIFGAFAFATGGILNVFLLPLPMLIFWSYKYLASYVREANAH